MDARGPLEVDYSVAQVVGEGATAQTLRDAAVDLLARVASRVSTTSISTTESGTKSIMFFAYDLGGLVVKEVKCALCP